jgi:hypothetical protein
VEQDEVLVAVQQVQEGIERLYFLFRAVRPEGVGLLGVALADDDAEQVGEATILVALDVEEDLYRLPGPVKNLVSGSVAWV